MGYYSSMILLIPAIILTFYAQMKVKSAFSQYSQIANSRGITGAQAARAILDSNGLQGVPIQRVAGSLTDNYNPQTNVLNLSDSVINSASVAAIGVAAHECGHAIQDAEGYTLLKFRNTIVPVVNFGSRLSWPILILGLILGSGVGDTLFNAGVVLFLFVVLFHLVTLPVELDASRRALVCLEECGVTTSDSEIKGAKKVLSAAALTYIAALAMAIANLLRILAMRRRD